MSKETSVTILTFTEACEFLKIKKSRLRTAVFRKEIPFLKIGRLIRFDLSDLKLWIEEKKTAFGP